MSFVWKAAQRLHTPEQVMAVIIATADELNMPDKRGAAICAGMCVAQESDFWCPWNAADPESQQYPHDSQSDDGRSVGYYQQQKGPRGELWWGPTSQEMNLHLSTREFLARLKKIGYNASTAQAANDSVQAVQRSGVPQGYRKHWDRINTLYENVADGTVTPPTSVDDALTPAPGFAGDPWWLADVLRAEGLSVVEVDGWQQRGQGDQGVLWGMVFHHTGSPNETPEGIANHPTLGLAAHLLVRPDGTVYVCGIGKANHAGVGSWTGLPTDNANPYTIGVEVAILPQQGAPHRLGWPDVQYVATVKTFAAVLRKLDHRSDRAISHKEWAQLGPAGWRQGKWDPGAINMDIFRDDVQAQIDRRPTRKGFLMALTDKQQQELYDKIMAYPGSSDIGGRWPSRSIYRATDDGVDDTVGMLLNVDGSVHELTVENRALMGYPDAIALVRATAEGRSAGAKLGDGSRDENAIARAAFVLEKCPTA